MPSQNAILHMHNRAQLGLIDPQAVPRGLPSLSGVLGWWVANGLTSTDGTAIASWTDNSGNGLHLVQASGSLQPLYKTPIINGQPVIRFDGVDDYLSVALSATGITALTLAIVIRPLDAAAVHGIWSWANSLANTQPYMLVQRDTTNVRFYFGGTYRYTLAHATNATHIYLFTWDGTSIALSVDGAAQTSAVVGSSQFGSNLWVGNGYNAYSNVDLPEIALYNRALTPAEQSLYVATLKATYGIA